MSFSIVETDVWPRLGRKIAEEIDQRVQGLRKIAADHLVREQTWIEALQWVLDEAAPKPPRREED